MFAEFVGLTAIDDSLCGASEPQSVLTSFPAVVPVEQIGLGGFFAAASPAAPASAALPRDGIAADRRGETRSSTAPSPRARAAAPAPRATAQTDPRPGRSTRTRAPARTHSI